MLEMFFIVLGICFMFFALGVYLGYKWREIEK